MLTAALIVLALCHEPHANDHVRFGLPLEPALRGPGLCDPSPVRCAWRRACAWENHVRAWHKGYGGYANPDADLILADAVWRSRVWFVTDDLADARRPPQWRESDARMLRDLIGPVDYFHGRLPTPTP